MIKKYLTTKFFFGATVLPPTDVEHIVTPDIEFVRFYYNLGGKDGDFEVPAYPNVNANGVAGVYISKNAIPFGSGITFSETSLDVIEGNSDWEVFNVSKLGKSYDPLLEVYGNIVYYIDIDISRLSGDFQIVSFYKYFPTSSEYVPPIDLIASPFAIADLSVWFKAGDYTKLTELYINGWWNQVQDVTYKLTSANFSPPDKVVNSITIPNFETNPTINFEANSIDKRINPLTSRSSFTHIDVVILREPVYAYMISSWNDGSASPSWCGIRIDINADGNPLIRVVRSTSQPNDYAISTEAVTVGDAAIIVATYNEDGSLQTQSIIFNGVKTTFFKGSNYIGGNGAAIFDLASTVGSSTISPVDFLDVLTYDRILTHTEINQLGAYLANKWTTTWVDVPLERVQPAIPSIIYDASIWYKGGVYTRNIKINEWWNYLENPTLKLVATSSGFVEPDKVINDIIIPDFEINSTINFEIYSTDKRVNPLVGRPALTHIVAFRVWDSYSTAAMSVISSNWNASSLPSYSGLRLEIGVGGFPAVRCVRSTGQPTVLISSTQAITPGDIAIMAMTYEEDGTTQTQSIIFNGIKNTITASSSYTGGIQATVYDLASTVSSSNIADIDPLDMLTFDRILSDIELNELCTYLAERWTAAWIDL